MNTYYVTFGQKHPLRDHYIIVRASSYKNAIAVLNDVIGDKWSNIYENAKAVIEFCSKGSVGSTIFGE